MLVGETRNKIDKLWNDFWSGGITNPLTVIEQVSYLLFIRRLEDIQLVRERQANRLKKSIENPIFKPEQQHLRWNQFKQLEAGKMLQVVRDEVFPFIKELGEDKAVGSAFTRFLKDAVFMIQKPSLLTSAVSIISELNLDNADTAGDLYEYLLLQLSTSGKNGQFRTPRHIIRMMVELTDPQLKERICDPACGTAGFLFNAIQYLKEKYTSENGRWQDEEGILHYSADLIKDDDLDAFQSRMFFGFDTDVSMLRVAAMNLWLHGLENPQVAYFDTLSKNFQEEGVYDLILANPPFTGSLDYADCNPSLLAEVKTKKTELLFLALALRLLDVGGRAAIIVPDGVLFGSSNAHVSLRKTLVEDHQLEGVISMPSGVFKPYAGVSTAILLFTKGGQTDRVWFYEMEHDGYSLDDKRQPIAECDIPDVIQCWKQKEDAAFEAQRQARMAELKTAMAPLKQERLKHQEEINRLQFESVLDEESAEIQTQLDAQKRELEELDARIHTLQNEFNQLSRQFWVTKDRISSSKYDLSASRYRELEQDEEFYPVPQITIERIKQLESVMTSELQELEALIR